MKTIGLILALLVLAVSPAKGATYSAKEIAASNRDKVLMIATYDADGQPLMIGSGFFVSDDGVFASNCHVIDGARSVRVKLPGSTNVYEVSHVVGYDAEADLVLLKIDRKSAGVTLGDDSKVETGERVFAIGCPALVVGRSYCEFFLGSEPCHFASFAAPSVVLPLSNRLAEPIAGFSTGVIAAPSGLVPLKPSLSTKCLACSG